MIRIIILIFLFSNNFIYSQIAGSDSLQSKKSNSKSESINYYQAVLERLTSPFFLGRAPESGKTRNVESFLKTEFRQAGIKPFANYYEQNLELISGYYVDKDSTLLWLIRPIPTVEGETVISNEFKKLGKDYYPLMLSANDSAEGKLVFVGHGISAPEHNYDDYKGVDVKGKIAMFFTGTPDSGDTPQGKFADYANLLYKIKNAESKGAVAVAVVRGKGKETSKFFELDNFNDLGFKSELPVIQLSKYLANQFFPKYMDLFKRELRLSRQYVNLSIELDAKLKIKVNIKPTFVKSPNFIGYLPGSVDSLNEEYIIVGAHYDGIGKMDLDGKYFQEDEEVFQSANDNASGIAGLLDLAKRFSIAPAKRPIIFIAFTGGNSGNTGSRYYLQSKSERNVANKFAMINLDVIGNLSDKKLSIIGNNSSPDFNSILDISSGETNVEIVKNAKPFQSSDHVPFFRDSIPVLWITSGEEPYLGTFYDTEEKIDYEGLYKIVNFAEAVIRKIANKNNAPRYSDKAIVE